MDFRGLNETASPDLGILRCPFLRNINEPTSFSFSSAMPFPMPGHKGKGPIFEDGPNFDSTFRLFHGEDGVIPLSDRSFPISERIEPHHALPAFNPLAAKAATISLSSFGPGGPFSFDAFSKKHESMSDEWLRHGNCPIAKSYRAVSSVLPLVAKALQPPPGMKLKCPPAIVAARAAISRTAFAKNLRPQPLPEKVLVIGMLGMAANVPLGVWREHTEKFSLSWFTAVHAAVPFIGMLRKSILMPKSAMAFTIAASILGQVIGSRAERYRLKANAKEAVKEMPLIEAASKHQSLESIAVKTGHGGHLIEYPVALHSPTASNVIC
ncbi:hypothetical protein LINGRAPRIM_LOCUS1978 [Linum grandiflorum]